VRAAVLQKILQLAALGRLGALALLMEALKDLEAVAPAVLLAGTKLRREAEVLGLLLRADANVITAPTMGGSLDPFSETSKVRR
jgi:hypothetical protein